jgi:tetratricopeptide (TPR) repeat protein
MQDGRHTSWAHEWCIRFRVSSTDGSESFFGAARVSLSGFRALCICDKKHSHALDCLRVVAETLMDHFNLGTHTRKISTRATEAQRWFNIGLNWCFGFNFEEGVKCFQKALQYDPECVMAHWGIAYGQSPYYNLLWREQSKQEATIRARIAYENILKARSFSRLATSVENQLVEALAKRFQSPHFVSLEDCDRWDDDYACQMRRVYYNYPDDHDVTALFVEALITRTPRALWNLKTGAPMKNSDAVEALTVCERSLALADKNGAKQHPAIVHLHIHVLEMSKEPERALRSADHLSTLCPDAGHMNHMPGHIYFLCGDYEKAKVASEKAICADEKYVEYAGSANFYTAARCHDLHLMIYTCAFLGQYVLAMEASNKLRSTITKDILAVQDRPKLVMTLEAYHSMRLHVMVRFGRWHQIITDPLPEDPELYPVTTAMHHYAKGVAYASLKRISEAEEERRLMHESIQRISNSRRFCNNYAKIVLAVGQKMLEGELEYHKGNSDEAYFHLRESVSLDDNLEYHEPWAWMHPPRHALGALLMERGYCAEAEKVYREDLGLAGQIQRCAQHPNNVWALHGLVECLRRRGELDELPKFQEQLALALQKTDIPITSSCMCRVNVYSTDTCCSAAVPRRSSASESLRPSSRE